MTKYNREEALAEIRAEIDANKQLVASLLDTCDFLDDDGYPTDDALTIIEKWHWDDCAGWFKFIESIWHLRSWGWSEGMLPEENGFDIADKQRYEYHISTAGWSGNESIIRAMQKNDMMWSLTWVQSRRGGHYIFEKKEFE
jgi:hypothetical protein